MGLAPSLPGEPPPADSSCLYPAWPGRRAAAAPDISRLSAALARAPGRLHDGIMACLLPGPATVLPFSNIIAEEPMSNDAQPSFSLELSPDLRETRDWVHDFA